MILVFLIEEMFRTDSCGDNDSCQVRGAWNSVFASILIGCVTTFILTFLSQVIVTAMDVCLFCYAVESDHGNATTDAQKGKFIESIKQTVIQGHVGGEGGAVVGQPVPTFMMVQAPAGSAPGQMLTVQTPQGHQVQVTIPEGVAPGQAFQVQIPAPAQVAVVPAAPTTVVGNP